MDLIFKVISDTPSTPAIVGDTDFQQHYTGVNTNMLFSELQPGIRQATEKYVIPYIGAEWYDEIAALYQGDDTLTDEQTKAIELLQDCVAYYTAYHLLPERNAFLASLGVVQNTPTEGSAGPVNQWGYKTQRWNALENGDAFLDKLLSYLEAQVIAGNEDFDTWLNSTAYSASTSAFFRRTDQLDAYLNIQGSRRSFVSLVKYMKEVEEDVLRPLLCDDQFEALEAAIIDATPDADTTNLLTRVRKAVAYLGLQAAIPHHRIVIDADGFRVVSQTDQFDERKNQTNNVHEGAIMALRQRAEQNGARYLLELENFLRANATTYPLWANSTCNTSPTKRGHSIRVSPDGIGGVGLF